jgi:hypothetical protein
MAAQDSWGLMEKKSSHPLTMPEPTLGISVKLAREVIRGWMRREM